MNSKSKKANRRKNPLQNPLILDSIFKHMTPTELCTSRLVSRLWNTRSLQSLRHTITTRLLLCADQKCARNLEKFLTCFENSFQIPYTRSILILDHLPTQESLSSYNPNETRGADPLNPDRNRWKKDGICFALSALDAAFRSSSSFKFKPNVQHSYTVYTATMKFATAIENLILTLSLRQGSPHNMEYWLSRLEFPYLNKLNLQITKTSPDDLAEEPFAKFFNSCPNLRSLSIRKLCKNSDSILHKILSSLQFKNTIHKLKTLFLEIFTEDSSKHLEILSTLPLALTDLTLLYLGGEVRFVEKLEPLKRFLKSVSKTLEVLLTHIPLFSGDYQTNFPIMFRVHTLKIEKVYREFAAPEKSQIFDFPFSKYFPNLYNIEFRDYDLWKNTQLKAFPVECIKSCTKIREISLPDLCFDSELMTRYFKMFPNIGKLSMVLSFMSKHQNECTLDNVFALLPRLKKLEVQIYDIDLTQYDTIFIGYSIADCEKLSTDIFPTSYSANKLKDLERKPSLANMTDLEILKITYFDDGKLLGISNLTVVFGFLEMRRLKHLTIGPSMITNEGFAAMEENFDVVRLREDNSGSSKDVSKDQSKFKDRNDSTSSGRHDCGHMCF